MPFRSFLLTAFILIPGLVLGAPVLRLTNSVLGPINIVQGAAGAAQEIEAYNIGDGQLNLTFNSSANWAVASASAPRNCSTRVGACIPVRIALQTQPLTAGIHTARVAVRDPNAVDAPQEILVTVQVGGGIPNSVNLFVAPNGGVDEQIFNTNAPLTTTVTTQSGGSWLSIALDGLGSFRFVLPYRIGAQHLAGLAEGTYAGTITTRSANFAPDNKTIQASMRVTSQPIVVSSTKEVLARVAQNSLPVTQFVVLSNRGLGTLSITGVTGTAGSGGTWLTAERVAGADLVSVKFDASSLAAGLYQGSVAITTNAVNSPVTVPVTLEVVAQSGPVTGYQRVVNNATFAAGEPLAPGGISAIFGEQLSYKEPAQASSLPLPVELGGARVFVNDRPAPVFFSSYGQINFQLPFDLTPGRNTVRVDRDGQRGNSVSVDIVSASPRFLRLRGDFAIAVNPDGTFALPSRLGIPGSRPARVGEAIVIYMIGLGPTNPEVAAGAASPADPLARVASNSSRVLFGASALGGIAEDTLFAGLTPGYVGLYQVNVVVPSGVPSGELAIRLLLDTASSDTALIAVE
ncbi:MAG: hypothetical protein JJE04_21805 [Acidobacteriia bacterium]|nr:hypothetical protein [Terriglobia bacterium]